MAQITTVQLPQWAVPKAKPARQARTITSRFSPTQFSADITSGDNVLIATLPKNARVLDSTIRFVGTSGLSLSFAYLRLTENSTSYTLTNPISTTTAGAINMVSGPPPVNSAYVKTLEMVVGGNSIDSTATGIVEITAHYDDYELAG